MTKSELIHNAQQEMAIDLMRDNIATIAGDVSDMKLDIVTIQNDIMELRQMIKARRNNKNGKGDKAADTRA